MDLSSELKRPIGGAFSPWDRRRFASAATAVSLCSSVAGNAPRVSTEYNQSCTITMRVVAVGSVGGGGEVRMSHVAPGMR